MLHTIPPVYDAHSKILILGSFPSVQSRKAEFFYAHPQNRFWRVLAFLCKEKVPDGTKEKIAFLLRNKIALWDVIASCDIEGSSDASIKNVRANDIKKILEAAKIREVFANGKKAAALYKKLIFTNTGREAICLPSTSPANAAWTFEKLCDEWNAKMQAALLLE